MQGVTAWIGLHMQLTLHTDYALRLVLLLARSPTGAITVVEAASSLRVSEHHLAKVAQSLVHAGVLRSQRGRNGGLALAVDLDTLRLGDLVAKLEPNMDLVRCFAPDGDCTLLPGCRLKGALYEARQAFVDRLNEHSLGELVAPDGEARHPTFTKSAVAEG